MLVKKGGTYKTGQCRIRGIVGGDLQKQIDFDQGKEIEVTTEQCNKLKGFNWCEVIHKKKEVEDVKSIS